MLRLSVSYAFGKLSYVTSALAVMLTRLMYLYCPQLLRCSGNWSVTSVELFKTRNPDSLDRITQLGKMCGKWTLFKHRVKTLAYELLSSVRYETFQGVRRGEKERAGILYLYPEHTTNAVVKSRRTAMPHCNRIRCDIFDSRLRLDSCVFAFSYVCVSF